MFLVAQLQVIENTNTHTYAFKNASIEAGSLVELVFPDVRIVGQITDMDVPGEGYPTKTVLVTGRIRNIEPWVIEQIKPGDTMINKASGEPVAEILHVLKEPPTSIVYFNNPRVFTNRFLEQNPRLQDVIVQLRLHVSHHVDGWRFAGNQIVKVGQPIRLYFDSYELPWVEVQAFEDET